MMVGLNDRRQFRETGQTTQALRAARPTSQRIEDPAALELDTSALGKPNETSAAAPESSTPGSNLTIPLISNEPVNIGEKRLFEHELGELFHEGP